MRIPCFGSLSAYILTDDSLVVNAFQNCGLFTTVKMPASDLRETKRLGPHQICQQTNAIIRVRAFADQAGLPSLKGPKPFGGHILSHDFVEDALRRRAGWAVHMAPDLGGSYEECPPSLTDYALRDRRWCQGNI